ncbi:MULTISPECIES: branched-chain amino acid ABC transporter permease [unclassified Butyrivibrio]|uniref:branched-chain amino acid ABC transporter permease n=1 Tax=unclassified Butyrivibrio TaxID=2639466 RepID=UPI0008EBFC75|nr:MULTISPECIES: branched-chain amino acid ABC transporter permease [unclassified Butyrivibrio]RKM60142.1 branched-chain amino acid ABC transporter permease [Butyrivibrio sp. XB500-5]SFU54318.1 branched-chain amino acid transport system permease protein [Butyrivibrio sp. INlla21]
MKINKITKNNLITYGIVVAAFVLFTVLASTGNLSSHMKGLLIPMTYYAVIAVALNLCVGILGELSIGHCGFMCIGAFTSAFFSKATAEILPSGIRFFLAFLIGIAFAALFGFLIGIPVLRLKGDYLAIVTLAFGEIIKNIINAFYIGIDKSGIHFSLKNAMELGLDEGGEVIVNGAMGITGTPHDSTFTIGIIVLLISLFVVLNLINSRDGRAIMAIRDNYIAAESTGINVTGYKMMAFTISAAIAGAAGVLFSHNITTLTATSQYFGYNASIMILVYVVLGGIGNIRGSVIAACILYLLPELLRGFSNYRMLIYSIVLIVMMIVNWSPKIIEWRKRTLGRFGFKKNSGKEIA